VRREVAEADTVSYLRTPPRRSRYEPSA
jgi:hypothetical protein